MPRSRGYKKIDRLYHLNELINKKVYTCEKIYIGRIVAIDSHSFIIRNDRNQEYTISAYWIREYDQENAVIDTSIRYLDYYQVKSAATV